MRVQLVEKIYVFSVLLFLLVSSISFVVQSDERNDDVYIQAASAAYPGYTLFAPEYYKDTYLMDNNGTIVNLWESDYYQALGTYLLENGDLIRTCNRFPNPSFPTGGFTGRVERFDWNGTLLWEFEYSNKTVCLHHDIEVLPNGNVLMLAWEEKDKAACVAAGRDPSSIPMNELWPDHIIEVEPIYPSGGNIVWEWHAWDHLIQDYDSTKQNYGAVEDHPELIDINFDGRRYNSVHADIHHTNSIDYNEELDQIVICVHNFCEIWVIDHSTTTKQAAGHSGGRYGKGGDLLYRWGNPLSYRAGSLDDQRLFGSHDVQWIDPGLPGEGHFLIYNNGLLRPEGKYSSVEELVPPVDDSGQYILSSGDAYGPEGPIWEYTADVKTDFYSDMMSGAQRLPNGNTLICEGNHGYFFEVTMQKEKVWDFRNVITFNELNPFSDDVFTVRRYPLDYPGIGPLYYQTPNQPSKPVGETQLLTANSYEFSAVATDPNDDNLYYLFDWDDGSTSGWIGPFGSGERATASHRWTSMGNYSIRVKVKDVDNLQTQWSDSLEVSIDKMIVWMIGIIDSKTVKQDEISFYADRLLEFSVRPFLFETYPLGVYMVVDTEYQGILTDRMIMGKFVKR